MTSIASILAFDMFISDIVVIRFNDCFDLNSYSISLIVLKVKTDDELLSIA